VRDDAEVRLEGGNTSTVVRVGDTVRRTGGHWTPATEHLLRFVRSVGFTDVPEPLGADDAGRQVVGFVPGDAGAPTPTPWFGTDEALAAAGEWLRRFHAAQAGYRPDPALPWRMQPGRPLRPGEVVCHHDVAPYNAVHRPDGGLAVIDFDFAAPDDPLVDLAFTAWAWVPLYADADWVRTRYGVEPGDVSRRLRVLVDAYGATAAQRERLLVAVHERMLDHAAGVEALAASGDPAFVRLRDEGVAQAARRDAERLTRNHDEWSAALTT
jgi:aminoglycoside phosphotransferase (APT) family kinase protein